MFIRGQGGNKRDGTQWTEGVFLVLCNPDDGPLSVQGNVRGFLVWTRLQQLGQFMMGTCLIDGLEIPLSGAYGADGLTRTVPRSVWERATPLPDELYNAWNTGGGHNSVGSEAAAIREWALSGVVPKLAGRSTWRTWRATKK